MLNEQSPLKSTMYLLLLKVKSLLAINTARKYFDLPMISLSHDHFFSLSLAELSTLTTCPDQIHLPFCLPMRAAYPLGNW